MRKILNLVCLMIVAATIQAQTPIQGKTTTSLYLEPNTYSYYWGGVNDTLSASDTITLELRVRGNLVNNIGLGLYVTKVSGTITNNFIVSKSIDGITWINTDTIALSNNSTGMAGYVNLSNFNYPYLRIQGIAGATAQKGKYKLYVINRN